MVALGVVLMVLGGLAIAAGVFVSEGTAQLLGVDLSALAIFLTGVASGAAVIWGFTLSKYGTKKALRERKDRKNIDELSQKLKEAEAERAKDASEDQ